MNIVYNATLASLLGEAPILGHLLGVVCVLVLVPLSTAQSQQESLELNMLKQEPGPGTLPEGVRAYVDDGTCPSGQVKQLTGGSSTTKRLRTCVSLEIMRAEEAIAPARWTAIQSLEKGALAYCGGSDLAYRQIEIRNGVLTATSDAGSTWTIRNLRKRLSANGAGRFTLTMEKSGQKVVLDIEAGSGPRRIRAEIDDCVFLWTPRQQ